MFNTEEAADLPRIPVDIGHLNRLAKECHETNQHWWHHPGTGEKLDRNSSEMLMLMVTEVAEATEGERKSLMDDHLPHRPMSEVELADVLIRLFDYAGAYGYDLDSAARDILESRSAEKQTATQVEVEHLNRAELLLQIVRCIVRADDGQRWGSQDKALPHLSSVVAELADVVLHVIEYAQMFNYDLDGAVAEKRYYNAHRADHTAEARLAAHGKKF